MDPALSLDSKAEVDTLLPCCLLSVPFSGSTIDTGRNGLVDGVGREVFGINECTGLCDIIPSPGENLEGTVPARALLVGVCNMDSVGGIKSGKPSWLGDSGMVSLNGVDPPLAGGPHRLGAVRPS